MNKSEYMKELSSHLRRLPREDYEKAMDYFREYFEEAGPEYEQKVIEDMGSPTIAADQIIRDLAVQNAQEKTPSLKRGLSAVWIGILAVFAAPLALPMALCIAVVAICIVLTVVMVIAALFLAAFSVTAGSVITCIGGIWLLFHSFANGIATLGIGIAGLGIGTITSYGCIVFCRWFLHAITIHLGKRVRGGKKHENK